MSDVFPGASLKTGQTTIGTTATQLVAPQSGASAGVGRACAGVMLTNVGASTVYVGGNSAVTVSTGDALLSGMSKSFPVDDPSRVWGTVASGACVVTWSYV
jgi:hypothetical protein